MRYVAVLLLVAVQQTYAWDSEELEVFDVVEEVKENFYEMLNLTKNATSKEIRTAFRRLSLVLHPDKNSHENSATQFRNLVSVYEVLKDDKKRAYYDRVLVNGMPNWKSAMFYYRRVRKMGFMEGAVILFTIFTIGQYLVAWAAYLEKFYTLEQQAKPRKAKKGGAHQQQGAIPVDIIQRPSVLNTLPFQIPYWSFVFIASIPSIAMCTKDLIAEKLEMHRKTLELKREQEREEEERRKPREVKKKKKTFTIPEGPTFECTTNVAEDGDEAAIESPPVSGGFWGDDDLDELVQLVKKYPGGTPKRWEVIAQCMGRSVGEVTFMANRMKANGYRQQHQEENQVVEERVKQKTKGGKMGDKSMEETSWTQHQQKALEDALNKFPKGATDRWDRIAELVPNKSRDDCILRYKYLVEVIKRQKQPKDE